MFMDVLINFFHFLFGDKTTSLFDLWSIIHFLTGAAIGGMLLDIFFTKHNPWKKKIFDKNRTIYLDILFIVILAYCWEFFEFFAEQGCCGESFAYWLQGQEFIYNRFLADPFLVLFGYIAGRRIFFNVDIKQRKRLYIPSQFISRNKSSRAQCNTKLLLARLPLIFLFIANSFIFDNSMELQKFILNILN